MSQNSPESTTLISVAELIELSRTTRVVILDCRHDLTDPLAGEAAYRAGHIPGAQFVSIDQDLSDHTTAGDGVFRGRHPLPTAAAWLANLRSWGIDDATQIVAYDAQGGMFAARLWWMVRWIGHSSVAVLDGGLPAWSAAGQQLSTSDQSLDRELSEKPIGSISHRPALTNTVTASDVLARLDQRDYTLLDARAPDRFFKNNLQADGYFKKAAELREEFAPLIANPAHTILQCGSGITACHHLLAMEIAGLPGAALYPGSWSEWCADPTRPVATGNTDVF
jgi:thiosulfate/3-mercaptopyruvate sulfurtransferase